MKKPKILMLRTAGTNCDKETAEAFKSLGCKTDFVHVNRLLNKEVSILDYDLFMISGGFSYGDDISAGKVLANELKSKLGKDLKKFVNSKRLVWGICNGFQVLVKCGLLPGLDGVDDEQFITLAFNNSDKFECRWVNLKREKTDSPFMKYVPEIVKVPIAHAEGKLIVKNKSVLKSIEDNSQVIFRYVDDNGEFGDYPINPNGSVNHIAGITNKKGNVLGMMPHPERAFSFYQTPDWTSKEHQEHGEGYYMFKGVVEYLKGL